METAIFNIYLTDEYLEVTSPRNQKLRFKVWAKDFGKLPRHIMIASKKKIETNKKNKKEKTLWDSYLGRNPYRQFELELTRDEAKLLYQLAQ